jgi:hypothetical protein
MQLNKKINNEEMKLAPVLIVLTLFLALFLIPSQMLQKEPEFAKKLPLRVHEGFQEKLAPASLDKPHLMIGYRRRRRSTVRLNQAAVMKHLFNHGLKRSVLINK